MKELIRITEQDGKQAVSARELHAFLENKTRFNDWISRRIEEYGLAENQDYEVLLNFEKKPSGGRPSNEYALSISAAKELAMVEGNAKGKLARQYFIACEQKLKEASKPLSQIEILQQSVNMLVEQERRVTAIEAKVDTIAERQEKAEQELKSIPVSANPVKELSVRDNIRMLVNKYSKATGIMQQFVWDKVYSDLYYRYHIDIKSSSKKVSESWLDVAERRGCMQELYDIASSMINQ
ncbi:MAG: antA/AntB antirepressor family protein [Tannerellaceae bacterium]|jgi:phage anti-repressor protein|nr:antA/AntB antirepressor family protein [Tannerellaceae bacterium]